MELSTKRLLLKSPSPKYAKQLLAYFLRNKTFFGGPTRPPIYYTLVEQQRLLAERAKRFEAETEMRFYLFKKEAPEQLIGDLGFTHIIKGAFWSCFVGYHLDQSATGQGYMTEALEVAITHLFEVVKLHRIEANIMPSNLPSIRVVERLGFQKEGLSPQYLKINGRWEDHLRYALLNYEL